MDGSGTVGMRRSELKGRTRFLALLALPFLAAVALVPSGCGKRVETMSLPEYRKRISEIHDGVAWDLGYALESLGTFSDDEYYHLQEVNEVFTRIQEIFSKAYRTLDALDPPEEALELHLDLMRFYADGERGAGKVVNSLGLFQISLPMLVDVDNLALPSLPEPPQPQEIRGAAEEDARTMDIYLGQLEGITPPEEMKEYLERLRALFRRIKDLVSGVLQVAPPGEVEALANFRSLFAPLEGEASALRDTVGTYLAGVDGRIDGLIERGTDLATRIKTI